MKKDVLPGLALAAVIALASWFIAELPFPPFTLEGKHPIEAILIAILVGLALRNLLHLPNAVNAGAKYCMKSLLPLGIVFLGARLNFFQVVRTGALSLSVIVSVIVVAMTLCILLARKFKVPDKLGSLIAVGTTICGGSAIAATAPVIDAEDKDVAFAVGTITVVGLMAMFIYPIVGWYVRLQDAQFGVWAGTAIHNTPQVLAAGFMWSDAAGKVATVVKMTRNLFIAPTVVVFGYIYGRRKVSETGAKIKFREVFPMFVLGFVVMALIQTFASRAGLVTDPNAATQGVLNGAFAAANFTSRFLIMTAMAGIGLTTNIAEMKKIGLKAFYCGLVASVVVAVLSIVLISLLHLNPSV